MDVLTKNIAHQERSLERVSMSYSRLVVSPERALPGLSKPRHRAYRSSL